MPGRISVVVPVYNVAAYLAPCLESLAAQSFGDLEIVIVDDGSTDESVDIAGGFAERDGRFKVVRQPNAGLGAARNTGIEHATGELLAFVDSDDLVPRDAYRAMAGALDESGSDFACGNVRRLTPAGNTRASFVSPTFKRTRLRTHISRYRPLIIDRTAWNKLFRRAFWDEHGFRFPEGVLYEDIPVTLPAHYLASTVDVVEQTVYLWRLREGGGERSITQRRSEPRSLRDRYNSVDRVSRFLAERQMTASKMAYDWTVVRDDLGYFLDVMPVAGDEFRALFTELVNDFLDRADPWALDQTLAIDRLKWELVRRRALPELLEVMRFEDEDLLTTPPRRERRHWYGDHPFRDDARLALPRRAYRLQAELAPVLGISGARFDGDALHLDGWAYLRRLGAPEPDAQAVELHAVRGSGPLGRVALATRAAHRPDVTADAQGELASLDWSGFAARLDLEDLKADGRWQEGSWRIAATIEAGGATRRTQRAEAPPVTPIAAEHVTGDGVRVVAALTGRELVVSVRREAVTVRSATVEDGVLELRGDARGLPQGRLSLRVTAPSRAGSLTYPVHVARSRTPSDFLARVPLDDLIGGTQAAATAHLEQEGDAAAWTVALVTSGGTRPVAMDEVAADRAWALHGRELVVERGRLGELAIVERSFRPVLTAAEFDAGGTLRISGHHRGPAGDDELLLAGPGREELHAVELRHEPAAQRFEAAIAPRPLVTGSWEILLHRRGAPRESAVAALVGRELAPALPLSGPPGHERLRLGMSIEGAAAVLRAEPELAQDERGLHGQQRLRTRAYPAQRREPLLDAVVYDCFGGRDPSDSPLAIHRELVRRGAPLEHLWVTRDGAGPVPDTGRRVIARSGEHYDAMARARYVVTNDHWPAWFERRDGQTALQTWHGPPLKRLGLELADRHPAFVAHRRALAERAVNWDVVLSPGEWATPILRRAFPIGGRVLETGLPRTDLLLADDREERAAAVRRRLGVDGDRRLVLYAPTYRDSATRRGRYRLGPLLDVTAVRAALGAGDVLLFRRHRNVVGGLDAEAEQAVLDVTAYPDATELLLAADVLVTDYGSAAFDFAITGRPLLFYVPDLEEYRDRIRGLSLDLEAEAPGPLLRSTEEVAEALRDPEAAVAGHRDARAAFVERYCALADGRAAERVVDRAFTW